MSQSNDRESNATFRVRYVDGQTETYENAVFLGIRDGHVGIETRCTSPRKYDGALWTETALTETHWIPIERVKRLDVEHGSSESVSDRRGSPSDDRASRDPDQIETQVRTHLDHVLTSLLNPSEIDEWHFEWTREDPADEEEATLWAALTVQGERFANVVWDPHPDLELADHLDEFVEGSKTSSRSRSSHGDNSVRW